MAETLECDGLHVRFGTLDALAGASLRVAAGEIVALLGPSGCGKTTLLRCAAGLQRLDSGSIRLGDRVLEDGAEFVPPHRRAIGLVFQEHALFPHLTVARNVGYGLPRGGPGRARVDALLEMGGLAGLGNRYPHQLSGGQQQRVAVLRSLAPRPQCLLMDEPFSNLDAALRISMRAQVAEMLRREAMTALLVTHDRADAFAIADRVAVMSAGRVAQTGTPEDVYFRPASPVVAAIAGEVQWVEGEVRGEQVSTSLGMLQIAGVAADGPARVAVRPEWITVAPEGIPAAVEGAALEGAGWRVVLRLPDGTRLVMVSPGAMAAPRGTVPVAVSVSVPVFAEDA